MQGKRLRQTLHMYFTLNVMKRTEYLRKNHIFAAIGSNCMIMDRKIPLYANLIKLGDNVWVASKVDFITHDVAHYMLNGMKNAKELLGGRVKEKVGCIEIGDNVFIGANSTVLPNVKIGSNVIIGAGTLVNKDVPDNSVVAGIPARVIGSFEDFVQKRANEKTYPDSFRASGESLSSEFADWLWDDFYKSRK